MEGVAVQYPLVTTWYENGTKYPWRLRIEQSTGRHHSEAQFDTYHSLMMHMADVWAELQPEPIGASV